MVLTFQPHSAKTCVRPKEINVGILDKLSGKKEEKPRPNFSDVQSGNSSTAREPVTPAPTPIPDIKPTGTTGHGQTYTVVAGDSLSKIAKRYYGDASKWPRIHEANRDQITNPDLIHPGQQLKIPDA
jgi:nucleoid-associated protein YgaU